MDSEEEKASLKSSREGAALVFAFAGSWTTREATPEWEASLAALEGAEALEEARFDTRDVTRFDSVLVATLMRLTERAEARGLRVDRESLPPEVRRLLALAQAVPDKRDAARDESEAGFLARLGDRSKRHYGALREVTAFVGECALSGLRLVAGRTQMRAKDFWQVLEEVGLRALPIVSLISFLMGVIISFLGAVTLRQFGAEFAVSYLVGYGMLREMGAVMTGIIMAGRTGAAYAAQIGSMKVNEEIDALRTFGIDPYDFLVTPRLLALFVMLPILTAYANVIGTLSGWFVAEFAMGVPGAIFFAEMNRVVDPGDFFLGISKAGVFGILVGAAGCLRGLQSGSGADAVGRAATSAVVTGITLIIFANAVIDWAAAVLNL